MALQDKLAAILHSNDSPKKIAISLAVGVFIGMSPLLGLHTILGITAAWIFRLNKFVTISGAYVTNPWTIVPIYTFATWFGAKILGVKKIMPSIDWNNISLNYLLNEMSHLLLPFVFGTTLLGLLSSIASYIIIYRLLTRRRQARNGMCDAIFK